MFKHPDIREDFNKDKKDIKNAYSGEVVLIANGPSLVNVPMSYLKSHKTIGTNNIYLHGLTDDEVALYPDIEPKFLPDFYTILGFNQINDPEKRTYCEPAIKNAELAFVNRLAYRHFDLPHVYAIHGIKQSTGMRPFRKEGFSYNIYDNIGIGYTNTYIMFQVLYFLGFDTVYCVGLDNDYSRADRLHFYPNDKRFATEPSMGRKTFQRGSNYVFGLAKEAYEKDGRKIININKINNTPFEGREPEWNG